MPVAEALAKLRYDYPIERLLSPKDLVVIFGEDSEDFTDALSDLPSYRVDGKTRFLLTELCAWYDRKYVEPGQVTWGRLSQAIEDIWIIRWNPDLDLLGINFAQAVDSGVDF